MNGQKPERTGRHTDAALKVRSDKQMDEIIDAETVMNGKYCRI